MRLIRSQKQVAALDCCTIHEIVLMDNSVSENDLLFHYFAELETQDKDFMCTWLHLFMRLHRQFFTSMSVKYFKSKGLTMDSWLDSMIEDAKGMYLPS